jgi:hypothetical protein
MSLDVTKRAFEEASLNKPRIVNQNEFTLILDEAESENKMSI